MKHKLLTILTTLALSACATPTPASPPPTLLPSITLTLLPTSSSTPQLTATPAFTATLLPSVTPVPIQSLTATNTELAPDDVGVCPVENPDLRPDFSALNNEPIQEMLEPSLDYLNQGGSPDKLSPFFEYNRLAFYIGDLTNDGVPEIGLGSTVRYDVVGCIGDEYKALLHFEFPQPANPKVFLVKDLNLNGNPDVVFFTQAGCGFHACFQTSVLEWWPTGFQFLSKDSSRYESPYLSMVGPYTLAVEDIDTNGTFELRLTGGIPVSVDYGDGLPWRVQTDTYMWDGEAYSFYRTQYTPPEYRFQAVQDGDEAMRWQEYDKALAFYQQEIFDDKLKAWSLAQRDYEWALWDARHGSETPVPALTPIPDPAEYPNLAAYARYRIMLLHLQLGHESDAKIVYDTLQQKFSQDQVGHAYAEMAEAFWIKYQETHHLTQSCTAAIEYATSHEDGILGYIGNFYYYGTQSYDYTPKDICPLQ